MTLSQPSVLELFKHESEHSTWPYITLTLGVGTHSPATIFFTKMRPLSRGHDNVGNTPPIGDTVRLLQGHFHPYHTYLITSIVWPPPLTIHLIVIWESSLGQFVVMGGEDIFKSKMSQQYLLSVISKWINKAYFISTNWQPPWLLATPLCRQSKDWGSKRRMPFCA